MTLQELAEIEARASVATEGPWVYKKGKGSGAYVHHRLGPLPADGQWDRATSEHIANVYMRGPPPFEDEERDGDANAEFIAAARTDVPALIAEVRRLKAELAAQTGQTHDWNKFSDPQQMGQRWVCRRCGLSVGPSHTNNPASAAELSSERCI